MVVTQLRMTNGKAVGESDENDWRCDEARVGEGWRDALLGALAWRAGYRLSCLAHQPVSQTLNFAYPEIRNGSVALDADC